MEWSVLVGKFVLHAGPVAAVGVAMWHYLGGTSYIPPMITLASHGWHVLPIASCYAVTKRIFLSCPLRA